MQVIIHCLRDPWKLLLKILTFIAYVSTQIQAFCARLLPKSPPSCPPPLVRIQTSTTVLTLPSDPDSTLVLASTPASQRRWCDVLFALSFAPGTNRVILGHPLSRAVVALDGRTGILRLAWEREKAAQFEVVERGGGQRGRVGLRCPCRAGQYLRLAKGEAAVDKKDIRDCDTIYMSVIPVAPELWKEKNDGDSRGSFAVRRLNVRIENVATGDLLCSVPGEPVGVTGRRGSSGGQGWVLEWHPAVGSVRVFDAQGLAVGFGGEGGEELIAAAGVKAARLEMEVSSDGWVVFKTQKGYLRMMRSGLVGLQTRSDPGCRERWWLRMATPDIMEGGDVRLKLRRAKRGVREVEADIGVPCEKRIAYSVISSFESFNEFLEDAVSSKILERTGHGKFMMEMVQKHSFLFFNLYIKMILAVRENKNECSIILDFVRGMGVRVYRGEWRVEERSKGRSIVTLHLATAVAVPAPGFLLDGMIRHSTIKSMREIREECIRRSITGGSSNM